MENEFNEVMSQRTYEELIKIATIQSSYYNPVAVEAAVNEIKKRGIDTSEFEETGNNVASDKEKAKKINQNNASSLLRIINLIIDTLSVFIISIIIGFFIQPI
ncbi:MAG: hypothetical protein J7K64_00320, partial [Bacteroidales bacterium]|nr:hypothetical protein [Bacteroidales bacterium]